MSLKIFLDSERIAWKASRAKTLWSAGKKFGIGSFIKPLNSPTRYPEYNAFFELIKNEKTLIQNVLDVGSPKLFTLLLAERIRAQILSTDIWDIPIKEASALVGGLSSRAKNQLKLAVADIRKPLPDDLLPKSKLFELIFSMSVIEHILPNPGGDLLAVENLNRYLAPGGLLMISVPVDALAREEYTKVPAYGSTTTANTQHFFQRVYDQKKLQSLLKKFPSDLSLEDAVLISWPNNFLFQYFWKIENTKVRGLLGLTFPFFNSSFQISSHHEIPQISSAGDLVLKWRKK